MVYLEVNKDPFIIYKFFMRIIGTWPEDKNKLTSAIIFSVSTITQIAIIITRLIDPHGKCYPYEINDRDFKVTLALCIGLAMHISLRIYGSRTVSLIESVTEDWLSIDDPEERKIMKRHNKFGTYIWTSRLVYLFCIPIIKRIISIIFPNDVGSPEGYIDREKCAFDEDSLGVIAKILTTIVLFLNAIACCAGNMIFWSFAMHLSSQCKILRNRFQNCLLMQNRNEKSKEFRQLVDRHSQILHLCGALEDSFNVFLGVQVSIVQFTVCMAGLKFAIAITAREYIRLPMSFLYIILILSGLLLFCYAGDCLTASYEEIGQVFIDCNWYDLSKDSITDYSIVITLSQMPKPLTVSKFYKLNLSNFARICEVIWSYISFLTAIDW